MVNKHRKLFPYYAGRIVINNNVKPYVFNIYLTKEAQHTPGILEKIAEIFSRNNISILQLKTSVFIDKPARIIVFADMNGKEDIIDEIKDKIMRTLHVENIDTAGPLYNGIAIDMWSFPVIVGGKRGVIMREHFYRGYFTMGWERLGETFGTLLFMMGVSAGLESYKEHARAVPKTYQLDLSAEVFRLLGYGVLEWSFLMSKSARAIVYDGFECSLFRGSGRNKPMGFFTRGMLVGWLSGFWGVDYSRISSRETKCIAKGDEYCEFEFKIR